MHKTPKGRRCARRPKGKGEREASQPEKLMSSSTLILRFVDAVHDVKEDFHDWIDHINW
jgi:hypothetical protein